LHNRELPVAPARRKEAGEDAGAPAVSAEAQPEPERSAGSEWDREAPDSERGECDRESLVEREFEVFRVSGDVDADIDAIRERLGRFPPSPEVGRADSRLPAASRVGGEREAGSLGDTCENDSHEHRDIPPPGSGLEARVRPPHFGGEKVSDSPGEDLDKPPDRSAVSSP
jgi:hypothetical protein